MANEQNAKNLTIKFDYTCIYEALSTCHLDKKKSLIKEFLIDKFLDCKQTFVYL